MNLTAKPRADCSASHPALSQRLRQNAQSVKFAILHLDIKAAKTHFSILCLKAIATAKLKRSNATGVQPIPAIVQCWRHINAATVLAVKNPGRTVSCGRIDLECDGDFLCIRLPSGRSIVYPRPTIIDDTFGNPCVSFFDNSMGQFKPCRNGLGGYGGLWTENIVQGIARDILGEALLRLEADDYPVVLHVHDEIVCEVPVGFGSLEEFTHLTNPPTSWALDLPIAASAWTGPRYCK